MSEAGTGEPLGEIFRRLIGNTGPISLMHYMGEANARYYSAAIRWARPAISSPRQKSARCSAN